jgi:hypothetical protein
VSAKKSSLLPKQAVKIRNNASSRAYRHKKADKIAKLSTEIEQEEAEHKRLIKIYNANETKIRLLKLNLQSI